MSSTIPGQSQPQQQQQQQFDQSQSSSSNQTESKFRIIKTDPVESLTSSETVVDPPPTDQVLLNGFDHQNQNISDQQQQQQNQSLTTIGNYQRRGRWLVKDFSPDQLIQQQPSNKTTIDDDHTVNCKPLKHSSLKWSLENKKLNILN